MPAHDLALLTDAARAAGEIALRFWKQTPKVWEKGADGPVTEADIAVNEMLADTLRGARPDYGWLSEETPDDPARLSADRVFIVDPIDGTRAFIAGEETFAHSLAVAEGGRVTAAAVYLPALDRLYTACLTCPAMRDGAPIAPSTRDQIDGASVLLTQPALGAELWPGGVPQVRRAFRASLAYRMCLVAEGRHDAMVTFRPTWEWDAAAGSLICARAGAVVTDRDGVPLAFNRPVPQVPGLIVAGAGMHAGLMARRHG
ncbi:MAG: 3'(2'),5'-bisphosphate nucleotidase CysQ [Paracoccaceae bacterium]